MPWTSSSSHRSTADRVTEGAPAVDANLATVPAKLSICVPAYNRPALLEQTLTSVMAAGARLATEIELLISDDSTSEDVGEVVARVLERWPGRMRYVRNQPAYGLVGNFNRCVELATGRWVLVLHDDDFLARTGVARILQAIDEVGERERAILFGVEIVNDQGRRLRRQIPIAVSAYLAPPAALERLVTRSSFVRFPAIVVRRDAYTQVGPFDSLLGNPTDLDMWIRIFARYGVRCVPDVVSAYRVHDEALSTEMFEPATVETLMAIFDRAAWIGALPDKVVRRRQADWFHQFILAGAFRRLRGGAPARAKEVMALFRLPRVRALGVSWRWLPVRIGLVLVVHVPGPLASIAARFAGSVIRRDRSA